MQYYVEQITRVLFWSHLAIFQSMFESYVLTGRFKSSCYCNMYQYSVIITAYTKNATINARSTKVVFVNYRIDIGA